MGVVNETGVGIGVTGCDVLGVGDIQREITPPVMSGTNCYDKKYSCCGCDKIGDQPCMPVLSTIISC